MLEMWACMKGHDAPTIFSSSLLSALFSSAQNVSGSAVLSRWRVLTFLPVTVCVVSDVFLSSRGDSRFRGHVWGGGGSWDVQKSITRSVARDAGIGRGR